MVSCCSASVGMEAGKCLGGADWCSTASDVNDSACTLYCTGNVPYERVTLCCDRVNVYSYDVSLQWCPLRVFLCEGNLLQLCVPLERCTCDVQL